MIALKMIDPNFNQDMTAVIENKNVNVPEPLI